MQMNFEEALAWLVALNKVPYYLIAIVAPSSKGFL